MGGNSKQDRVALFWAFGEDNLHSIYHSMAAIKRQMEQNLETEYKLSKQLSDIFDKNGITYELDEDLLKKYLNEMSSEGGSHEY